MDKLGENQYERNNNHNNSRDYRGVKGYAGMFYFGQISRGESH